MLTLFVFVFVMIIFARQFTGPRPARWTARVERFRPVARYLRADARATATNLRAWREARRFRRQLRRT